jgi:beta-phosphoglucomutase family hydrolase
MTGRPAVDRDRFDAVLFDLDGVLTATAETHFASWKKLFDGYLRKRAEERGETFEPFGESDYRQHVDGKPRYDGVRDFLASRGIRLPHGSPQDPPSEETICGLGNLKNEILHETLEDEGVEIFQESIAWVKQLQERGIKTAVVSSSKNCQKVLEAAGIESLFEVRVDGNVAAELGLSGKPAPDTFLTAADRLGVAPERAVVVEDAISGVEAGRSGGFGLVVGVAREEDPEELRNHGADIVVGDLGEMLDS